MFVRGSEEKVSAHTQFPSCVRLPCGFNCFTFWKYLTFWRNLFIVTFLLGVRRRDWDHTCVMPSYQIQGCQFVWRSVKTGYNGKQLLFFLGLLPSGTATVNHLPPSNHILWFRIGSMSLVIFIFNLVLGFTSDALAAATLCIYSGFGPA